MTARFCEFCGDGPTCCICGRNDPAEAPMARSTVRDSRAIHRGANKFISLLRAGTYRGRELDQFEDRSDRPILREVVRRAVADPDTAALLRRCGFGDWLAPGYPWEPPITAAPSLPGIG